MTTEKAIEILKNHNTWRSNNNVYQVALEIFKTIEKWKINDN